MRTHTFTIFLRGFSRSARKFLLRKNDRKNIVNACIYIYFCRSVDDHKMVYLQHPSFYASGREENLYFSDDIKEECCKYLTNVMNDNMNGKAYNVNIRHYKYTIYSIDEMPISSPKLPQLLWPYGYNF